MARRAAIRFSCELNFSSACLCRVASRTTTTTCPCVAGTSRALEPALRSALPQRVFKRDVIVRALELVQSAQ